MNIETYMTSQADKITPQARLQQLLDMSAASWSLDYTRLPDGGASLVRMQTLGVPNAGNSIFDTFPNLVSTGDPHTIEAMVTVAGVPITALQQYDRYLRELEKVQDRLPLFTLPHFWASLEQNKLAFALGTIFGLVYGQGTYFYYRPADELSEPVRLGQGWERGIDGVAEQGLTQAILERVDTSIARMGLEAAIQTLAGYYTQPAQGRTPLDALQRELKRLVREYGENLQQMREFDEKLTYSGHKS